MKALVSVLNSNYSKEAGSLQLNRKTPAYQTQTETTVKSKNKSVVFLSSNTLPSLSSSHSIFHILSKSLPPSLMESPDSSGRGGVCPQPHVSADRSSCLFFTLFHYVSVPLHLQWHYIFLFLDLE